MRKKISRRRMLVRTGQALAFGSVGLSFSSRAAEKDSGGAIITNAIGAPVGEQILADGGNAIDAAVATALVACVASPHLCGVGGYGGHMTLAVEGGKKVSCINFNTTAPLAARPGMYSFDKDGAVVGAANRYGWLACGVPGTLSGLQLALDKYGTRSFRELAQPAIKLAKNGVTMEATCAKELAASAKRMSADPGSVPIYFTDGKPIPEGEKFRNPELAAMLTSLAERNSVESFYRGDIAQRIAEAFAANGGLVTARDMSLYHAREEKPLQWTHEGQTVFTARPTAGGLTALQCLQALGSMDWAGRPDSPGKTHALLEVMRLAWKDRLERLGDPQKTNVPIDWLLSSERTSYFATQADEAARNGKALDLKMEPGVGPGTTNVSSVDARGNVVCMTLTHGGSFGAQVTVKGLGVTLGQGMYKFNPRPGHPNSPDSQKQPLHNMCPSVVVGGADAAVAVGSNGGLMIPNAMLAFLIHYMLNKKTMAEAVAAPRLHTTGLWDVTTDSIWPAADTNYLSQLGFKVKSGPVARVGAAAYNEGGPFHSKLR